ncbi:glycosyltransferase [Candidatus Woesearchaeota archaeon]|jgi:glycosyltransferase involved in cell wall biosynthesis|nr:glycosyltransferase [Candidatus Woesearchaeota archaeon]
MFSIDEAKQSDYKYIPSKNDSYILNETIVTVIIDCYYGIDLVKQSIQSILNQDYNNVELLIIDNGSEKIVSNYISRIHRECKNVSLIVFKKNQFSWNDTQITVAICWNAGVIHAKGEIIGHLNYDDMLSSDCCSKMANLFLKNSDCVTAGPLPVSINIDGKINREFSDILKSNNSRGIFINGKELAVDFISGSPKKYFSAPGGILFVKKELIIKTGGFDRNPDITQIIKFSVYGDSGFDSTAKLFWRHHDGQLNRKINNKGIYSCNSFINIIKNEKIVEIWKEVCSDKHVRMLKKYIRKEYYSRPVLTVISSIRAKKYNVLFKVIWSILCKCPKILPRVLFYAFIEVSKMISEKFIFIFRSSRD